MRKPRASKRIPHQYRDGGITIEAIYTGESFTKARGGITQRRPTNYRSNLDLVSIVDTAKMGWWDNGRLFVYGQNLSGRPLSASEVGDIQLFSNLDSTISETERPNFTTIAEYWYEHLLFDSKVRVKIGKQDANADYDGTLPSGPQGVRWGFDTLGHNGAISLYQLESFGKNRKLKEMIKDWGYSFNSVGRPGIAMCFKSITVADSYTKVFCLAATKTCSVWDSPTLYSVRAFALKVQPAEMS